MNNTLSTDIKKKINTSLSGDLIKALGFNMIPFPELNKYSKIEQVCSGDKQACILHVPVDSKSIGHWVAVWIIDRVLYYFCSYGTQVSQIAQLSDYMISTKVPDEYYLSVLIDEWRSRGNFFSANTTRYQNLKADTSTCGRYTIIRLHMRHLDHAQFKQWFHLSPIDPDRLVTMLTFLI